MSGKNIGRRARNFRKCVFFKKTYFFFIFRKPYVRWYSGPVESSRDGVTAVRRREGGGQKGAQPLLRRGTIAGRTASGGQGVGGYGGGLVVVVDGRTVVGRL